MPVSSRVASPLAKLDFLAPRWQRTLPLTSSRVVAGTTPTTKRAGSDVSATNPSVVGGDFRLNPDVNIIATNEIGGSATAENGTGAELGQVLSGVKAAGSGCGDTMEPVPVGGTKMPKCWLVIVARRNARCEHEGTPFVRQQELDDHNSVMTSPLSPQVWQYRIAIPLDFRLIPSACNLGRRQP
jgi:hypothetical protein